MFTMGRLQTPSDASMEASGRNLSEGTILVLCALLVREKIGSEIQFMVLIRSMLSCVTCGIRQIYTSAPMFRARFFLHGGVRVGYRYAVANGVQGTLFRPANPFGRKPFLTKVRVVFFRQQRKGWYKKTQRSTSPPGERSSWRRDLPPRSPGPLAHPTPQALGTGTLQTSKACFHRKVLALMHLQPSTSGKRRNRPFTHTVLCNTSTMFHNRSTLHNTISGPGRRCHNIFVQQQYYSILKSTAVTRGQERGCRSSGVDPQTAPPRQTIVTIHTSPTSIAVCCYIAVNGVCQVIVWL